MTENTAQERAKALEVIDEFIFHDIWNHVNVYDGEWDVTWIGYKFLAVNNETNRAYGFEVDYKPVTGYDWSRVIEDQEWEGVEFVED